MVSAAFTVIAVFVMGFPGISAVSVLQTFIQIILNCLFLYVAVMPVIVFAARIPNGHMLGTIIAFVYGYGGMFASGNAALANVYPVTASLGLIRYRSYDPAVHWNVLICLFSMIAVLMITAFFVFTAKGNVTVKAAKKHKKATKKGW
ncbi:MAG: ABC transporter permease subunit, partial [Lachnospiraceae bacterium]|nr:ABC transporter permease subunit [Lachnospiraceae bacterium]